MINPSLDYYPELADFVKKSYSEYQINYFGWARVYRDGRIYSLLSDPSWAIDHTVKNKSAPAGLAIFDELEGKQLLFRCENYDQNLGWAEGSYLVAREKFNIRNPLTCLVKNDDYIDEYIIDIHHPNVVDIYLNQLPYIEDIFKVLKYQFKDLVAKVEKEPLIFDNTCMAKHTIIKHRKLVSDKEFLLYHNNQIKKISIREYSCLKILAKGARIKDIARQLKISPRTVETYLKQIKSKFNIHSTRELILCYWSNQEF